MDKFDIYEACYVYAMLYHSGQFSRAYALFGKLSAKGFRPSPLLRDETSLTNEGREIFSRLVAKNY